MKIEQLLAYCQALVDADMGHAHVYVQSAYNEHERGVVKTLTFLRNEGTLPEDDEPGGLVLRYEHLEAEAES